MKVRKESLIENVTLDISSGHAVVGVVRETGRDAETQGIHVGDRVASIVKSIVPNPRYATVPIERVAKVPFGVDSAQAACAAYTYMIAFQSLNHGKVAKDRYSFSSLENKIVLIMDGVSVIGQALIEMAYTAGAFQVYAVGNSSQHAYISSLKAQPLFPNTETWPLSVIEGVDVVIDLKAEEKGSLLNHSAARMALKKNGKLVCIGSAAPGSMQIMSIYEELQALIRLCLVDEAEATYYDLFSTIDHYPEKIKVNALLQ
jgi:NADPH:quinone reductase-like Zn-dependent oxidoreductase